MNQSVLRQLRTMLVLGRVSNLPTIWSNCLAGWWLSGHDNVIKLPLLFIGASALYTGGMFLNDAFDEDFDRRSRPERPIPSGAISPIAVWLWGWGWLAMGLLNLFFIGRLTGILGVALVICIVLYDATHKAVVASPWLSGICRFWVYVIAGSIGSMGLSGWPIWCGTALALYVAGMGCMAWQRNSRSPVPKWPLALIAAPVLLAMLLNTGSKRLSALLLSIILVLWVARCTRSIFQPDTINLGRIISGLMAGIVFVDWLAVAPDCPRPLSITFLLLFGATLCLQRFVPEH